MQKVINGKTFTVSADADDAEMERVRLCSQHYFYEYLLHTPKLFHLTVDCGFANYLNCVNAVGSLLVSILIANSVRLYELIDWLFFSRFCNKWPAGKHRPQLTRTVTLSLPLSGMKPWKWSMVMPMFEPMYFNEYFKTMYFKRFHSTSNLV